MRSPFSFPVSRARAYLARVALIPLVLVAGTLSALHAAEPRPCTAPAYECAVALVEQQEFTSAVAVLRRLVRETPANLKALNLLGIALTGTGRVTDANATFEKALALDASFYPARKNLAINEFNRGRLTIAERQLTRVLRQVSDDEVVHLYLAEIAFQRKQCQKALPHFAAVGRLASGNPDTTLHHGLCLIDAGRTREAVEALRALPEDAAAQRFEAGVALGRGKAFADAAQLFAAVRGSYKDPYAAAYNQLLMLVRAGDHHAASALADDLLSAEPKRAELQSLAAQAFAKAGRVKDAYDAIRLATTLEPANEDHYLDLAAICVEHDNYDLGLEIVGIGLQQRPDSWVLQLQRGVLWAMKAQLFQAEESFEAARRIAPDRSAPYAALAMVWMQTGRTPKAVQTLRDESRRRTRDHVVPYMFAVALMRSGVDPVGPEATEAVAALRTSIATNASFAPAHSELGRLLLKRDDVDGSIRELEKATFLDPGATAALYNLAQAYRRKGDRTRAAELLARVNKLNTEKRGDDPERELRQIVVRIVREGSTSSPTQTP